jgi:hypothetical protein
MFSSTINQTKNTSLTQKNKPKPKSKLKMNQACQKHETQ